MSDYTACAVPDCCDSAKAKGLCNRHYLRVRVHGSIDLPPKVTDMEWFEGHVDPCGPILGTDLGRCWLWTAGKQSGGYGKFRGKWLSHTVVYELLIGPVGDGLCLDHLCRNRICCNPLHLEPVTTRENILRGMGPAAIAVRTGQCQRGHLLMGENLLIVRRTGARRCLACVRLRETIKPRSKTGRTVPWSDTLRHAAEHLSAEQVRAIRIALSNGERQYMLAKQYGVDKGTISNIHRGVCYRWVT